MEFIERKDNADVRMCGFLMPARLNAVRIADENALSYIIAELIKVPNKQKGLNDQPLYEILMIRNKYYNRRSNSPS